MHIIFMTRYSFLGRSDWQSPVAADPAQLFDDARLTKRAHLFERIALRSLADQTDPDFQVLVLSSQDMPDPHKARLTQMCGDLLGDRAHVVFAAPGQAGKRMTRYRTDRMKRDGSHVVQTILDDDDAVATHFAERIKAEARAAVDLMYGPDDYTYISHARGISLVFSADGTISAEHRSMPATTQGLSLVAPRDGWRSPFKIAHKKILERRPVRVIHGGPIMYARGVHDTNDSRAQTGGAQLTPDELHALSRKELPLLRCFIDPA